MSSEQDVVNALKAELAATAPARLVTRDYMDFADRDEADLSAGIFTVLAGRGDGYQNLVGRMASNGLLRPVIVGQILLPDSSSGSAVEDAELAMLEDVKTLIRRDDLPPPISGIEFLGFQSSGQLDAPYGWCAIQTQIRAI